MIGRLTAMISATPLSNAQVISMAVEPGARGEARQVVVAGHAWATRRPPTHCANWPDWVQNCSEDRQSS